MAHYVQAPNVRPKLRRYWGVVGLSIITAGLYLPYWWYRSARDLQRFQEAAGTSRINATLETALASTWLAIAIVLRVLSSLWTPAPGAPPQLSNTEQLVFGVGGLAVFGLGIYLAYRTRQHVLRAYTLAGVLPEERPGAVGHYAHAVLFGSLGTAASAQAALRKLWLRYPRYYPSIGGTQADAVAAMRAQQGEQPQLQVLPGGSLGGVAPTPAPASASEQQPAASQQRLAELAPKATDGSISVPEALEYAQAVDALYGEQQAAPWFRYVHERAPEVADAAFWLGRRALASNDEAGVAQLRALANDATWGLRARHELASYMLRIGRPEEAQRYLQSA